MLLCALCLPLAHSGVDFYGTACSTRHFTSHETHSIVDGDRVNVQVMSRAAPILAADIAEVLATYCADHVVAPRRALYFCAAGGATLCVACHPRLALCVLLLCLFLEQGAPLSHLQVALLCICGFYLMHCAWPAPTRTVRHMLEYPQTWVCLCMYMPGT